MVKWVTGIKTDLLDRNLYQLTKDNPAKIQTTESGVWIFAGLFFLNIILFSVLLGTSPAVIDLR